MVVGQFVNESGVARGIGRIHGGRVYAYQADSHEKAQQRGRQEIAQLVDLLSVRPREESLEGGAWAGHGGGKEGGSWCGQRQLRLQSAIALRDLAGTNARRHALCWWARGATVRP